MDYKEKYEEALERARTFSKRWDGLEVTDSEIALKELKEIFPELKESEDLKIKRDIQYAVRCAYGDNSNNTESIFAWLEKQGNDSIITNVLTNAGLKPYKDGNKWCILAGDNLQDGICGFGDTIDEALFEFLKELVETQGEQKHIQETEPTPIFKIGDLLKRKGKDYTFRVDRIQGGYYHCDRNNGAFFPIEEQNNWELVKQIPTDKIKPKFKVGYWVIHNETGTIYQVKEIVKLNCGYAYNLTDGGYISSFKSDEYRLWTINDAKDGDILAVNDTVVIFKDLYNASTFHSYCHIKDGVFNISKDDMPDWWRCEGFKPANIEQGELLFKTMNEAGYVWDPEHKELKQFKQNTACCEKYIANVFEKVGLAKIVREKGSDELTCAVQDAMIELSKFISQSNPTWGEEDEETLNSILNDLSQNVIPDDEDVQWLKSLKERMKEE